MLIMNIGPRVLFLYVALIVSIFVAPMVVRADSSVELGGTVHGATSGVVATLADANNPVEVAIAPLYTRNIVLMQRTTRLANDLTRGAKTITPTDSTLRRLIMIQSITDSVSARLGMMSKATAITKEFVDNAEAASADLRRGEDLYNSLRGSL